MDDSRAEVLLDLGGQGVSGVGRRVRSREGGGFPSCDGVHHFFASFCQCAVCNLHVRAAGDGVCLLAKVTPAGPACHAGADTCWGERNRPAGLIAWLEGYLHRRKDDPVEESYTARLCRVE